MALTLQADISHLVVAVSYNLRVWVKDLPHVARVWWFDGRWCLKHLQFNISPNTHKFAALANPQTTSYQLKWRRCYLAGRVVRQFCAVTGSSSAALSQTQGLPLASVALIISGFGHS